MAEDAKRLLNIQLAYERETDHKFAFAGLSVNDFIYTLLSEGLGKRAEKVRADWRVPDQRSVSSFLDPHFRSCFPLSSRCFAGEVLFTYANGTDDRFWWIKLKALARNKDWDGLEAFARYKKSPIGYEPFVVRPLHYR